MREPGIDVFRGVSIILMVFFTLALGLSRALPDILVHNRPFSLHPGDLVLPMFLFASGMSIVFYRKKISGLKPTSQAFYVAERFGRLAVIWFWLAPFTAGDFFEMDELMLSAVLFVPSYIIAGMGERAILGSIAAVSIAYLALGAAGALPDFTGHYLGGFAAAPFYLPVMLWGVLAGRNIEKIERVMLSCLIFAAILLLAVPPDKLNATPSFMALSAFVSIALFGLIRGFRNPALEYIGKDPIRYWVLMVLLIIVPIKLYAFYTFTGLPLGMGWPEAVAISLAACLFLYLVSLGLDLAWKRVAVIASSMRAKKGSGS